MKLKSKILTLSAMCLTMITAFGFGYTRAATDDSYYTVSIPESVDLTPKSYTNSERYEMDITARNCNITNGYYLEVSLSSENFSMVPHPDDYQNDQMIWALRLEAKDLNQVDPMYTFLGCKKVGYNSNSVQPNSQEKEYLNINDSEALRNAETLGGIQLPQRLQLLRVDTGNATDDTGLTAKLYLYRPVQPNPDYTGNDYSIKPYLDEYKNSVGTFINTDGLVFHISCIKIEQ